MQGKECRGYHKNICYIREMRQKVYACTCKIKYYITTEYGMMSP
jgi:hypothetical protein